MIGKINSNPQFKKRMEADSMVLLNIGYKEDPSFLAKKKKMYIKLAKKAGVLK